MTTRDARPWWWWINPWLYIKRRDTAYDDALDIIYEFARPKPPIGEYTPEAVAMFEFVAGTCPECGRRYCRDLVKKMIGGGE